MRVRSEMNARMLSVVVLGEGLQDIDATKHLCSLTENMISASDLWESSFALPQSTSLWYYSLISASDLCKSSSVLLQSTSLWYCSFEVIFMCPKSFV